MVTLPTSMMAYNATVEKFRDDEYPMMQGKVYLDHAGTTIYAKSLIERFSEKLLCNLYGNPHSNSDPSQLSSRVVEATRNAALLFLGADPEYFDLIFTANATAAIKLVGESFQDLAFSGSRTGTFFYGYHRDAHTSLVGVRELTTGTHHCFGSDEEIDKWLDEDCYQSSMVNMLGLPGLFAYPGQSNMTGRRLPLSWAKKLRQSAKPHHQNTYSLLDAAALATTSQLDFSDPDVAPDFTAVSFYKIFGFPDLGGLIVRKKSGHILSWRRYFGGGTVNLLTVLHQTSVERKDNSLHEALEDGTLPFHNIIALGCALEVHKKLYGSMVSISKHTSFLLRRLHNGLTNLRHHNNRPVCVIYTDSDGISLGEPATQGATIAFSVTHENGTYIPHTVVENLANDQGIYVRSGGLCNSGGITHYLQIEPWQFKRNWSSGHRCGGENNTTEVIHGRPTGVVRVSLGAMSTIADVDTFLNFMSESFEGKSTLPRAGEYGIEEDKIVEQQQEQEGYRLVRTDSGFHSRSGGSTAGSLPLPVRCRIRSTASVPNISSERQRQLVKSRSSHESMEVQNEKGNGIGLNCGLQPVEGFQRWPLQDIGSHVERRPLGGETKAAEERGHGFGFELKSPDGRSLHMRKKRSRFKFWRERKVPGGIKCTKVF